MRLFLLFFIFIILACYHPQNIHILEKATVNLDKGAINKQEKKYKSRTYQEKLNINIDLFNQFQKIDEIDFEYATGAFDFNKRYGLIARVTSAQNIIDIYSVDKREFVETIEHGRPIQNLMFSPKGNYLAVISGDCVKIINIHTKQSVAFKGKQVRNIKFSPDERYVAIRSLYDTSRAAEKGIGNLAHLLTLGMSLVNYLESSAYYSRNKIELWDIRKKERIKKIKRIYNIEFSQDSKFFKVGGKVYSCSSGDKADSYKFERSDFKYEITRNGNIVSVWNKDGNMTAKTRFYDKIIKYFQTTPDQEFILLKLKSGEFKVYETEMLTYITKLDMDRLFFDGVTKLIYNVIGNKIEVYVTSEKLLTVEPVQVKTKSGKFVNIPAFTLLSAHPQDPKLIYRPVEGKVIDGKLIPVFEPLNNYITINKTFIYSDTKLSQKLFPLSEGEVLDKSKLKFDYLQKTIFYSDGAKSGFLNVEDLKIK